MAIIRRIISGGQIGADIAALRAARQLAIETGGWMPQGFQTLDGPMPQYETIYGMEEHECRGYPPRTRQNVLESDGTVRFAEDFSTRGEICTLNAIREFDKPYHDISIVLPAARLGAMPEIQLRQWLRDQDIEVLNVAGNARERLEPIVETFLIRTISRHNRDEGIRLRLNEVEETLDDEILAIADEEPSGMIDNTVTVSLADVAIDFNNLIRNVNFTAARINISEVDDDEDDTPF